MTTEQTVAHGAGGRAVLKWKVVRRGPVNGAVTRLKFKSRHLFFRLANPMRSPQLGVSGRLPEPDLIAVLTDAGFASNVAQR